MQAVSYKMREKLKVATRHMIKQQKDKGEH